MADPIQSQATRWVAQTQQTYGRIDPSVGEEPQGTVKRRPDGYDGRIHRPITSWAGSQRRGGVFTPTPQNPSIARAATLVIDPTGANNTILYTAVTAGVAGNGITVRYVDPAAISQALSVSVSGRAITVNLATDGAGVITTTATLLIAAIVASGAASALVTASAVGTVTGLVPAVAALSLAGGEDAIS